MDPPESTTDLPPELTDVDRVAVWVQGLLDNDMAAEAVTRFSRLRPADQADAIVRLSREAQAELLSWLTPAAVGMVVGEMDPEDAVQLSHHMAPRQLASVLDEASPDVAADVLRGMPEELAARTIEGMREASNVTPLMEYEDDAAGGLMTPEFVALRDTMTVVQAMAFVRRWAEDLGPEDVFHLFVVDGHGALAGVISLAQLVLAKPYQHVSLLMDHDVISVTAETDQEHCARLMERYNLRNLPVADGDGKLVGVLKLEDMIDVVDDEATEDMFRMFGVGEEERVLGPFWRSVRGRLPWLCVNLGTAMLAALVVTLFESTLAKALALAAFLPVIAGQGGIAGTQTLTLIVRSLALGEISRGATRRLLAKEVGLGLVHGLALGLLVGLIVLVWHRSGYLALVVGAAMASNMVIAGAGGVLVPLGFRALRIDPALASAVAVTTITDVVGFLIYLGLAAATIGLIAASL